MASKKYWFRAKKYGYGWDLPLTWQGWLVYVLAFGTIIAASFVLYTPEETIPPVNFVLYAVIIGADLGLLMRLCKKYGEPARWRWGKK